MKRLAALLALLVAFGAAGAARASAPEWRSQQPLGAEGLRTNLGEVGDVECWAANRCLLITAGNGGVAPGLFAYDGNQSWYRYSTVCGGHKGRIAWAGPDEFWTISDQQSGQETGLPPAAAQHVSLCHFKDGAVVASYAEPLGVPGSYLPMNAAACMGPDECWFAGDRLPGTVNFGAFHLYWNGLSLSAAPSLAEPQPGLEDPGRSVVGLAFHQGALYEGVRVQEGDEAPGEPASQPYFLHRVLPGGPPAFVPQEPADPIVYGGSGAQPGQLEGFRLSSDGEGLWAVSGALSAPAGVTVLRLGSSGLRQLPLSDPTPAFALGDRVTGLAAEPGAAAAWVGFRHNGDSSALSPARLALVHADGTVDPPLGLPAEGEGISRKGFAGPIVCAEAGQCWMATSEGWLFHLGSDPAPNDDPAMHTLVTYRPPDASLPSVPPISLPEDDSGAYKSPEEEAPPVGEFLPERRPRRLLSKVHQRLLGEDLLELTFVLHAKAHVKLVASRKGQVVAATKRYTMAKGARSLRLRLDPKRWPTKLDLQVHPVGKAATG